MGITALELLQLQLRISLSVASCEISGWREKRAEADQDWPEGRDDRPIGKALQLGFKDGHICRTHFFLDRIATPFCF